MGRLFRRLSMSGKLLLLTIPFVLMAAILIYVPSIANFRINRLNDRVAAANTAALVLEAAPSGMVPDDVARQGIDALLAGKDHVYAASAKTKMQGAMANAIPGSVKGAMHEKMAKPLDEKKAG